MPAKGSFRPFLGLRGRLGVSLVQIFAFLVPVVRAQVHLHAVHVFAIEYEDAFASDAESISDLVIGLAGNAAVIQLHAERPKTSVSLHILASGGKGGSHESLILAEQVDNSSRSTRRFFP